MKKTILLTLILVSFFCSPASASNGNSGSTEKLFFYVVIALIIAAIPTIINRLKKIETKRQDSNSEITTPEKPDLATLEARIVAGLCPKCGNAVAATDQNCPSCQVNLAWAHQNLDQLV